MTKLNRLSEIRQMIEEQPLNLLVIKTQNCTVCEAVEIKAGELLQNHTGVSGIWAYLEDIPELASEFLTLTAPTVLVFYQGKEVYRSSRFVQFAELEQVLTRYEQELRVQGQEQE